jgi:hypothetical protein
MTESRRNNRVSVADHTGICVRPEIKYMLTSKFEVLAKESKYAKFAEENSE